MPWGHWPVGSQEQTASNGPPPGSVPHDPAHPNLWYKKELAHRPPNWLLHPTLGSPREALGLRPTCPRSVPVGSSSSSGVVLSSWYLSTSQYWCYSSVSSARPRPQRLV